MRRFFCDPIPAVGSSADLPLAEAKHALTVLRLEAGSRIGLLDGRGVRAEALITRAIRERRELALGFTVERREQWRLPLVGLHVVVAPPRNRQMDLIIHQCVELGVARITPVLCEHAVSKPEADRALASWRDTAIAALKQSGNPFLLQIEPLLTFTAALEKCTAPGYFGTVPEPAAVLHAAQEIKQLAAGGRELTLWIGPEGGFNSTENAGLAARGLRPLALGNWTLRVETAVAALTGYLLGAGGDDFHCRQLE